MFQAGERVKVDLSGMVVKGVSFSQNVREALGTAVTLTCSTSSSWRSSQGSVAGM